jgi:hypothetical protein
MGDPLPTAMNSFLPSSPPSVLPGQTEPQRLGSAEVRYRQRPHRLAPEREYRVGPRGLRWHDAGAPGQGAGELPFARLAGLRLLREPGPRGRPAFAVVLVPHRGAALRVGSWSGTEDRGEAYRRFVRALHAAAVLAQPALRVEAVGPGAGGWQGTALLALLCASSGAAALGVPGAAAGLLAAALLSPGLRRWQAGRRPGAPVRGGLPRQLLP